MERKAFLKTAAIGSIAVCVGCFAACKKEEDEPQTPPTPLPSGGIQVDLSKSENAALVPVGGSLVKSGVIIAHTEQDKFVALQVSCTHAGSSINYVHSSMKFVCPTHGSEFSLSGAVTRGPATAALTKYTVTRNGEVLTITN